MGNLPIVQQNATYDHISLSVPDTRDELTPRGSFSSNAGGDTSLVLRNTYLVLAALPLSRIPGRGSDVASMQYAENLVQNERAACYHVLQDQRDGFEQAARMYEFQASQDQLRAESLTSLRIHGEYQDAMVDARLKAEQEVQLARQEIIQRAELVLHQEKTSSASREDKFRKGILNS